MPDPARMKIVSIRMSEDTWEEIQNESLRAGISASEFIREATIYRLGYRWAGRMNDTEMTERLRRLGVLTEDY
jgi:mobilization protein NikA